MLFSFFDIFDVISNIVLCYDMLHVVSNSIGTLLSFFDMFDVSMVLRFFDIFHVVFNRFF